MKKLNPFATGWKSAPVRAIATVSQVARQVSHLVTTEAERIPFTLMKPAPLA
jgi:hypothetical protein